VKKTAKKRPPKEAPAVAAQPTLGEFLRAELREYVIAAGMAALGEVLERERTEACGPRYAHLPGREARRAGTAPGELIMGGRRVAVRRPRARTLAGTEVALPTWARFGVEDPLDTRAVEQMLVGVSTRRYERSLEAVPVEVAARGTSKSAVSRRFVAATERQMGTWLGRDLGGLDLVVLMVDGIHIAEHVLLVALGVDIEGGKHVLGVREGATENATSCTALLTDLRERGMRTDRTLLAVLDGGKALARAVRDVFGTKALIQRCQVHKRRNILDELPEAVRPSVAQVLRDAYGCRDAARATKMLTNLARRLRVEHPGAAASVEEGLDETLTVMRLGLPKKLERQLSTTNAIENLMGAVRRLGNRVKRWRSGQMILRWVVTAVADAAGRFRRITGAREGMAQLRVALASHDVTPATLATRTKAA
jgi:putative transposase